MFMVGIWKDNGIVDVDHKVLEDHVLNALVHGSNHGGSSIAVALLYDPTTVIYHVSEEGGVLFRVFFDSDIVVPIC